MGKAKARTAAESFSSIGFAEIVAYRVNTDNKYGFIAYHRNEQDELDIE